MLSASEFADEIGVQRSNISHILSGRNKPSLDFIIKIKDRFPEIQWEWIIEGKGDMIFSSPTPLPESKERKINLQKEKFEEIPNLFTFTNRQKNSIQSENKEIKSNEIISSNSLESDISIQGKEKMKISNSQLLEIQDKKQPLEHIDNQNIKIQKIIFFYNNGKFEIFEP